MQTYEVVPPWILFKSVYFSTITNFIDLFKFPEQEKMIEHLYHNSKGNLSSVALVKLMMDTLYICMDYRNIAAHGGYIYNYNSDKRLRTNEIFGEHISFNPHGFSKLLFLLDLFDYGNPVRRLETALSNELKRHCKFYPQDINYLGQILNMNIIPKKNSGVQTDFQRPFNVRLFEITD